MKGGPNRVSRITREEANVGQLQPKTVPAQALCAHQKLWRIDPSIIHVLFQNLDQVLVYFKDLKARSGRSDPAIRGKSESSRAERDRNKM